jgi:hypothetical protein
LTTEAKLCVSIEEWEASGPGAILWGDEDSCLYMVAPTGDRFAVPIAKGLGGSEPRWRWDGNRERPTLDPSINYVGRWHGWLRDGKFTP